MFSFMYITDHIFPVLPIKHLVNHDGEPTTPQKLASGTKPLVSNLCVLLCQCVVQKSTGYVETKVLNMRHQSQKGFGGIFVGITQHQKGYLIYIHSTEIIVSSREVIFDNKKICYISIHITSAFRGTFYVTRSIIYSVRYIIS